MLDLKIEMLPTVAVRPYARNARKHSRRQVHKIAASIREYGFTNPILVDEAGEIIAGHGRLEAAKLLGHWQVPTIRLSNLSKVQKQALRLADNEIAAKSKWSIDLLVAELADISATDFDIQLTGFDTIEVDKLITPSIDFGDRSDDIPPPPAEPTTRRGDLWKVGDHAIVCGDALDVSAYRTVIGTCLADMVATDPPYNVPIAGHVSGNGNVKHDEFAMASGEMSRDQFATFSTTALRLSQQFSRDGALVYVFGDWRMIAMLITIGETLFTKMLNLLVWAKSNPGMGSFYRSGHELIAVFKNGNAPHTNNIQLGRMGRNRSNVLQYPGGSSFSKSRARDLRDHPTPKPIAMIADLIRDATKPGDLVLDMFAGAGSTMLAAEMTGRKAALIEIEPKFVDVTLRRFQELTGVEAVLMPDRIPFSELQKLRSHEARGSE